MGCSLKLPFLVLPTDLYLDLVAQDQRSNLLVETWQRNRILNSSCSHGYCVRNIRKIRFPDTGVEFSYTKDHSKWAVSDDNKKIICVGDNNREVEMKFNITFLFGELSLSEQLSKIRTPDLLM